VLSNIIASNTCRNSQQGCSSQAVRPLPCSILTPRARDCVPRSRISIAGEFALNVRTENGIECTDREQQQHTDVALYCILWDHAAFNMTQYSAAHCRLSMHRDQCLRSMHVLGRLRHVLADDTTAALRLNSITRRHWLVTFANARARQSCVS